MRKRDIAASTAVYWMFALMIISLAMIVTGDCPISPTRADYEDCVSTVEARRNYGFLIAIAGYPLALTWLSRRRGR